MKEEIIIDTEVKGADKAEKDLESLAKATNKADDAGEKYEGTLKDLAKETEVFGVSINALSGGLKNSIAVVRNSVKGLKAFKVALASTGIGLLVVALGSLVAWLQNTQQGLNFVNDAFAVLSSVVSSVINLFTQFGSALGKIFSGEFKEGFADLTSAVKNFTTNVKEGVQATLALEQASRDLQRAQAEANVTIAQNNEQIAKNKRVIEDVTKSTQARIKAGQDNLELIKENARIQEELAQEALRIEQKKVQDAEAEAGRTVRLIEDQIRLSELEAEVIAKRTEGEEKQIEFANKLNELNKIRQQEILDEIALENIKGAEIQKTTDIQIQSTFDIEKAQTESFKRLKKEASAYTKAYAEEKQRQTELAELAVEAEYQLTSDLFGALAGLAGQDTAIGKALAITQAIINTNVGITQALKAPTLTQRILGVAFASATGLKAISDIKGEPIPKVSIDTTTPFGRGGLINGDLHSDRSGGTMVLAEGGEAIINRRSVAMFKPLLSRINEAGGGVPIMANGGMIPDTVGVNPFMNLERAVASQRSVLVLDDLDQAQNSELVTRVVTTL